MKKVAIITYHASHNNGSFLQAYALQEFISSLDGYTCEIINFRQPEQQKMYSIFEEQITLKGTLKNLFILLHYKDIKKRYDTFELLMQTRLQLSENCYHKVEELTDVEKQYDLFISGSDQIWNAITIDFSDAYLLSFVTNKPKISYAASLGGRLEFLENTDVCNQMKELLQQYSALSVRENIAKKFIQELTDKQVVTSLDPTLLLDPEKYNTLCAPRLVEGDYIFFYYIEYIPEAIETVAAFSAMTGLPVVVAYSGLYLNIVRTRKYGFKIFYDAGPDAFLSLIKYAKYVLSNSFHGVVFSIIMKKQFYAVRSLYNGEYRDDDRLDTLLEKLGLEERQLKKEMLSKDFQLSNIDYSLVDRKLEEEKQRSKAYLNRALAIESTEKKHDL